MTNLNANNIGHIDLQSGVVTFPYTGFNEPFGVAISPDGRFALVANEKANNIGRIELLPRGPAIQSYTRDPAVYAQYDDSAAPNFPVMDSSAATRFELSPPCLPAGLFFDDATGAVMGTPQQEFPPTAFTVTPFGDDDAGEPYKLMVAVVAPSPSIEGTRDRPCAAWLEFRPSTTVGTTAVKFDERAGVCRHCWNFTKRP